MKYPFRFIYLQDQHELSAKYFGQFGSNLNVSINHILKYEIVNLIKNIGCRLKPISRSNFRGFSCKIPFAILILLYNFSDEKCAEIRIT